MKNRHGDVRAGLARLAALIRKRNEIDLEMAGLLGRPATAGNLGEFIAAAIFDIELAPTGVNPGHDGSPRPDADQQPRQGSRSGFGERAVAR